MTTINLPANAPRTSKEAFEYVGGLCNGATIDDLKILALVEAIGLELYTCMAQSTDNQAVRDLLMANGREELIHGQRVAQALEILTGEPFPLPPIDQNPLYTPMAMGPLTKESLNKLAEAEFAGGDLYAGVAASFDNAEAKALFQQNGQEELEHGNRLARAAELLA